MIKENLTTTRTKGQLLILGLPSIFNKNMHRFFGVTDWFVVTKEDKIFTGVYEMGPFATREPYLCIWLKCNREKGKPETILIESFSATGYAHRASKNTPIQDRYLGKRIIDREEIPTNTLDLENLIEIYVKKRQAAMKESGIRYPKGFNFFPKEEDLLS